MSQSDEVNEIAEKNEPREEREKSRFLAPGKGILKQRLQKDDDQRENLTISNIPVPENAGADDSMERNNTTSRLSVSRLHSKIDRRVSFAPDVTLHRVEIVPQHETTIREPRRKSNMLSVNVNENQKSSGSTQEPSVLNETMELTEHLPSATRDVHLSLQKDEAISNTEDKSIFENEVSMEITQLFSKHSARPANDLAPAGVDQKGKSLSDGQEEMELTKLHLGRLHNTEDDSQMSVTEMFSKNERRSSPVPNEPQPYYENKIREIRPSHDGHSSQLQEGRHTTEFFTEQTFSQVNNEFPTHQDEHDLSEIRNSQVLTSTQQFSEKGPETLESSGSDSTNSYSGEGASLKKRRLEESQYPIHSEQENREGVEKANFNEDMDLTMMERLSPIDISMNLGAHPNDDYTKTAAGSNVMNEDSLEPENEPKDIALGLKKVFNLAGISFHIGSEKEAPETIKKISFETDLERSEWPLVNAYTALYGDMPVLEIYAFCCKELLKRIQRSRQLFKELEEQIALNPPPALYKMLTESESSASNELNQNLHLIRDFSRLEAAKVWFEWRCRHLNGIKIVLQENLGLLREELSTIEKRLNESRQIKKKVLAIRRVLKREIELAKEPLPSKKSSPPIPERLKLEIIKAELKREVQKLDDASQLEKRAGALRAQIEEMNSKIKETQYEISSLTSKVKKSRAFAEHEIFKLKFTFQILQEISGLKLDSFTGTRLSVKICNLGIRLAFHVDRSEQVTDIETRLPDNLNTVERELYTRSVEAARLSSSNAFQFLSALLCDSFGVSVMLREYKILSLRFPCRLTAAQSNKIIEIRFFDPRLNIDRRLLLPLDEFISAVNGSSSIPIIKLEGDDTEGLEIDSVISGFRERASSVLPWLKGSAIK